MKKKVDIAALVMGLLALVALFMKSFIIVLENRISKMEHISGRTVLGGYFWIMVAAVLLLLISIIWKKEDEKSNFVTGIWASICMGVTMFFMGLATNIQMDGRPVTYRVTFGISIYLLLLAFYGVIVKCNGKIETGWKKNVTVFTGIIMTVIWFASGWMNKLSIMTEYFTRQEKFMECLVEHVSISLIVMVVSLIIGIPLGYLCYRYKAVDFVVMGFLNIIRSIPSIALIMVMVTPLSMLKKIPILDELGVGAFGFTPVFCALLLYALFQIVNSMSGALKTIDPNLIKTAKAMGMTSSMVMYKVQIPIILPVVISGVRVAIISTFTAASLGSMVGFGGLGTFIRMGSGGAIALDMILLGAVPIMIMIFIADFIFTKLGYWFECRLNGKDLKIRKTKESWEEA